MDRDDKVKSGSLKFTAYLIILAGCAYYLKEYTDIFYKPIDAYDKYKLEQSTNEDSEKSIEESIEETIGVPIDTYIETEESEELEESSASVDQSEEYVESEEASELVEEDISDYSSEEIEEVLPELEEVTFDPIEEEVIPTETYSSELLDLGYNFSEIDFTALKEASDDVRGWITIDGTNIDLPVMQYTDNDYYLHHDIDGTETKAGMVFQDARTVSLEEPSYALSDLTIIYGHYLKGEKMFAQLHRYKKRDFVEKYPFGVFYTTDGYAYKISFFAGHVINGVDDSLLYKEQFVDEDDFNEYINSIYADTTFTGDVEVQYGDKIIALVTCSYETKNSRYVLYGKLDKQYTNYIQINEEENERVRK